MPGSSTFLTAHWKYLAMVNYAVDPALLAMRIPPGTEIDFFAGHAFVSVVGFRFVDTRLGGIAIPFHQDFDEINLRFYVRRRAADGWRRGVAFVRELVPKRAIATVARFGFHEPYATVSMSHDLQDYRTNGQRRVSVAYRWSGWGTGSIQVQAHGDPAFPAEGSVEQFIAEHYWGYGTGRAGVGLEYSVKHDPWRLWIADDASFSGETATVYGSELARVLERTPHSSLLAEGSPISVSWARSFGQ